MLTVPSPDEADGRHDRLSEKVVRGGGEEAGAPPEGGSHGELLSFLSLTLPVYTLFTLSKQRRARGEVRIVILSDLAL